MLTSLLADREMRLSNSTMRSVLRSPFVKCSVAPLGVHCHHRRPERGEERSTSWCPAWVSPRRSASHPTSAVAAGPTRTWPGPRQVPTSARGRSPARARSRCRSRPRGLTATRSRRSVPRPCLDAAARRSSSIAATSSTGPAAVNRIATSKRPCGSVTISRSGAPSSIATVRPEANTIAVTADSPTGRAALRDTSTPHRPAGRENAHCARAIGRNAGTRSAVAPPRRRARTLSTTSNAPPTSSAANPTLSTAIPGLR